MEEYNPWRFDVPVTPEPTCTTCTTSGTTTTSTFQDELLKGIIIGFIVAIIFHEVF